MRGEESGEPQAADGRGPCAGQGRSCAQGALSSLCSHVCLDQLQVTTRTSDDQEYESHRVRNACGFLWPGVEMSISR